jgi:hypothetical protein
MDDIKVLEFNTLRVIGTGIGSSKYIRLFVQGNKIKKSSDILVGTYIFKLDYILPNGGNTYRLTNSNETLVVEKT